ncbi:MAG: HEAT repeat domain-containing protein [Agriterribacter sp.]
MAFYDLSKEKRAAKVIAISNDIYGELKTGDRKKSILFFSDDDTYIRRSAYLSIGKLYLAYPDLQKKIIQLLHQLQKHNDFKVRQTVINAAGEIGKHSFDIVQQIFDKGLFDEHHSPRNAVIGSIKKMGEVNPVPVLQWAKKYLHHPNKEIRREICHGIELRGRKHPQDILPLLQQLEFDTTARVSNTLVHVIGQIAYKKGCLEIVIQHLNGWKNKALVAKALEEIIDVHHRYKNFSYLTQEQAKQYIAANAGFK